MQGRVYQKMLRSCSTFLKASHSPQFEVCHRLGRAGWVWKLIWTWRRRLVRRLWIMRYALTNLQAKAVKLLISGGAELDNQDNIRWTALHWATFQDMYRIVLLLLESGSSAWRIRRPRSGAFTVCISSRKTKYGTPLKATSSSNGDKIGPSEPAMLTTLQGAIYEICQPTQMIENDHSKFVHPPLFWMMYSNTSIVLTSSPSPSNIQPEHV